MNLEYWAPGPGTIELQPGVRAATGSSYDGYLFDFWIDYGDVPFSVPGFGWHKNFWDVVFPVKADIFELSSLLNIRMYDLFCCEAFPNVDDPLFSADGVTLAWNANKGYYAGSVGDNQYVVAVYDVSEGQAAMVFVSKFTGGNLYILAGLQVHMPGPQAFPPIEIPREDE